MRPHPALGLPIAALLLFGAPAAARTVRLPEGKPVVSFDVPDDWTLTPVGGGLELSAPDHTSVIVTGLVKRSKSDITAWQKDATKRMLAFGIKFDPKAKGPKSSKPGHAPVAGGGAFGALLGGQAAPPVADLPSLTMGGPPLGQFDGEPAPAASPAEPAGGKDAPSAGAKPDAKTVDAKTVDAKTADAKTADAKTADAKPAEAKPADGKAADNRTGDAKTPDAKPADAKSAAAKPADGKPTAADVRPHFSSAVFYGATLGGKPVDVEFLNFVADNATAFLMQQESGATDARAAAVVKSVRLVR